MPGLSDSSADDRPAAPGARAHSLCGGGWGVMGRPLSGFGHVARVRPGPDARPPPTQRRAPLAVPLPPPTITPPQSECALAPAAGRRCPNCGESAKQAASRPSPPSVRLHQWRTWQPLRRLRLRRQRRLTATARGARAGAAERACATCGYATSSIGISIILPSKDEPASVQDMGRWGGIEIPTLVLRKGTLAQGQCEGDIMTMPTNLGMSFATPPSPHPPDLPLLHCTAAGAPNSSRAARRKLGGRRAARRLGGACAARGGRQTTLLRKSKALLPGLQDHARTPRDGRGNGGRPGRGCSRARSLIGVPPVEARTAAAAADGHRRRVRDGVRARRRSV
eukprot:gene16921-biopygen1251